MVLLIILQVRDQEEIFKKPGGMPQMPFGWTHIGDGLHHVIFGGEGRAQLFGLLAHLGIAGTQGNMGSCWHHGFGLE